MKGLSCDCGGVYEWGSFTKLGKEINIDKLQGISQICYGFKCNKCNDYVLAVDDIERYKKLYKIYCNESNRT